MEWKQRRLQPKLPYLPNSAGRSASSLARKDKKAIGPCSHTHGIRSLLHRSIEAFGGLQFDHWLVLLCASGRVREAVVSHTLRIGMRPPNTWLRSCSSTFCWLDCVKGLATVQRKKGNIAGTGLFRSLFRLAHQERNPWRDRCSTLTNAGTASDFGLKLP